MAPPPNPGTTRSRAASGGVNRWRVVRKANISLSYVSNRPSAGPRVGTQAAQHPPIVSDGIVPLRRLDNLNHSHEAWVLHDASKGVGADSALGDPLVAIEMGCKRRLGVVEVQALEVLQANFLIEPVPHTINVSRYVIPRCVQMGGVQAKPHARPHIGRHRFPQRSQLLEARAEGCARAGGALDEDSHIPRHSG